MIELRNLRKSFGPVDAVKGVSLTVRAGECLGLLGPNGAGKTTIARLLLGLTQPSDGEVYVFGEPIRRIHREVYRRIGVVFDTANLYDEISVRNNLLYSATTYGVSQRRVGDLIEQFGLGPHQHKKFRHLSKGLKQRASIARALVHDPELLLLDEPTTGLDPDVAQDVRAILDGLHQQGKTLLLITHLMQEAEQLCTRVSIIKAGQIAVEGTVPELRDRFSSELMLRVRGQIAAALDAAGKGGLHLVYQAADSAEFAGAPGEVWSVLRELTSRQSIGDELKELHTAGLSLEDVYIKVVSGT